MDDRIFEEGESATEGSEKRNVGIMRRIRRVSAYIKRGSTIRKRNSTSMFSVMSEATVAAPDEPRLQLRNVLMFLILSNVCLWIVQSLEGTAFQLNDYRSVLFFDIIKFQ